MIQVWSLWSNEDQTLIFRRDSNFKERVKRVPHSDAQSLTIQNVRSIQCIHNYFRERERQLRIFLWLYDCDSYDFIQWRREWETGEGGLWAAEFRKSSMDAISLSCQKKKNEQYVPSQPPGPGHWRKSNRTNALPVTDSQLQSQFIGLVLVFLLWVFEFFKNYYLLF